VLNRLEVDRAVFYAIASRAWQFLAGPVTMVLIATYFSKDLQGYYYTFWSIVALQSFFDLSLHQVLINFASHEWEQLSLAADGSIAGEVVARSRLSSLLRGSFVWYGAAAVLFFVVVSAAGIAFFSQEQGDATIVWRWPWIVLVLITALLFMTTPCLAILEGCNQVRVVYKLQLIKSIAGNVVVWLLIPWGAQLWVPAAASLVRLACEGWLLGVTYRRFFQSCAAKPVGEVIHWRNEVWPFQWRVGSKGMLGYLNTFLIHPVVFHYDGAEAAGQFGMSWQVLTSVEAACVSWVKARAAKFGMLVSKRQFIELDRIFARVTSIAAIMCAGLCLAFLAFDMALYWSGSNYAHRLLSPFPTLLLAAAMVLVLISESQWTYIHAHKRSPYMLSSAIGSAMSAVLILWWGATYSLQGVCLAYLVVNALYYSPLWSWVWWQCRREWHGEHKAGP
jgi:O-antigen/teichoic acid export membrane protein